MFASTITDLGVLALAIGIAVSIVLIARVGKNLKASFAGVSVEVGQINRAVNHVEPGETSLIQKVRNITTMMEEHTASTSERFDKMNERIDHMASRVDALTEGAIQLTARVDDHINSRTGEYPAISTGP